MGAAPSPFWAPYWATGQSRFQLMLQYRGAALAGFFTQTWFGGILIMVLAAFYAAGGASRAPISLAQVVTYTWMSQAFLVLVPWGGDPVVSAAVRNGSVSYDRLRPVDAYFFWFAGAAGNMTARMLPRAVMICTFSAFVLPLVGLGDWSWRAPAGLAAAVGFAVSACLIVLLSSALTVLFNLAAVVTLDNRGLVSLITAVSIAFSGNLIPLPLYPDGMRTFLFVQPFAGLMDIPFRIYLGDLAGPWILAGIGMQVFWIAAMVLAGRALMAPVMGHLQVQGG